ncbi:MAG: hypothetical protein IJZ55_08425 [Lachnospiraceae bacterium]|nr:hypothetical protein [Lachnospiraceae bacterium]
MKYSKKSKITPFEPWETKHADGFEKRYFRLGASIMASEPMRSLSANAFRVYCHMRIESAGKRSFIFPYCKYKSFMTRPTFFKALKELETYGFIDTIQHNRNLRKSNIYSFSDRWKQL